MVPNSSLSIPDLSVIKAADKLPSELVPVEVRRIT